MILELWIWVGVKALAGLDAELISFNHGLQGLWRVVSGILGFIIVNHFYIVYHIESHGIHEAKWALGHTGPDHPAPIDIFKIHESTGPHIEGFPLDGTPNTVETETKALFLDR